AHRSKIRSKFSRLLFYILAGAAVGELALLLTRWAGGHMQRVHEQLGIRTESTDPWLWGTLGTSWVLPVAWPLSVLITTVVLIALGRWARFGWMTYLIPLWSQIQKSRDLSVFCSTLGLRLRSGATMVEALRSAQACVGNVLFRRSAGAVVRRVEDGEA